MFRKPSRVSLTKKRSQSHSSPPNKPRGRSEKSSDAYDLDPFDALDLWVALRLVWAGLAWVAHEAFNLFD